MRHLRLASDPADTDSQPLDRSITVKDAAALLGCDDSTVRRLLEAGEFEGHRIGVKKRGVRIYLSSVQMYRERNALAKQPKNRSSESTRSPPHRSPATTAEHKEAMAFLKSIGVRFSPR
ncbi:helix-turn-helix domain-containing protein [Magnetospirillum molischianum]